mgnify:CR=1 FL=1
MIKLIYINDTWLPVENIDDVSTIIREYYNEELADQMDQLIPEHINKNMMNRNVNWKIKIV